MNIRIRNFGLGAALAACALTASAPAMARDGYRDGGNDAAIAIGAGVIGLALGAAIADRGDRHYYDRGYYDSRRYVTVRGRPGYYYYYDGAPGRYYQDRYYDRYYAPYYRDRWSRGHAWGNRDWRDDRRGWRGDDHRGWGRDDRPGWGRDDRRGWGGRDRDRHDDHRGDDRRHDWRR
jgi:hypothetical protein